MTAELDALDLKGLYHATISRRDRGDLVTAERMIAFGMLKFGNVVDQHGHPLFHKELVRLWVDAGDFTRAQSTVPADAHWHEILFARAYTARNQAADAERWWRKVQQRERRQPEAMIWLFNQRYGYRNGNYPSPFNEMVTQVEGLVMDTIFDVGANDGQSCLSYAQLFPRASIRSFEPVPQTFETLRRNIADRPGILPVNLALGETVGTVPMQVGGGMSTMNRVGTGGAGSIDVPVARLDSYCRAEGIERINFLKIDTEGYDLTVLKGCGTFIERIDFIQCEVSANSYNTYHTPYAEVFSLLTAEGFHLFGIYGQTFEWTGRGYPVSRRFDPVFINRRLVGEMNDVVASR